MPTDPRAGELERYIRTNLVIEEQSELSSDTQLVSAGLVDSMGVVMLAAFVEERYGVRIEEDEILAGSDTIAAILTLVDARR